METMTPVETIVACPSCANPMSFRNDSWQCLACHPIPTNIPTCATQKCKRPLTKLPEPWNCLICLHCNKHPAEVNKTQKAEDQKKRIYLDQKVTPDDVQKIVDAAVAKALAAQRPAYPPSAAEIQTMTAPETVNAIPSPTNKPETYLQKAKRLGVKTHDTGEGGTGGMRKKAEIVADIESLEKEETIEEAKEFSENAQSPPGEDAEFARGLTDADMM